MQQTYKFLFVGDVMEILGISKSKAYEIIRKMNKELEAEGYETIAGRVPRRKFCEKSTAAKTSPPRNQRGGSPMYRPQSREEFRRQQEQRKRIRADLRALSRVTTLIIFGGIIARIAFIMFDKLTSRAGLPGGEMFLPLYVIALPYFGWKLRALCHPEKPRRKIKRKETYKCTTTFVQPVDAPLTPERGATAARITQNSRPTSW